MAERLDARTHLPSGMEEYLSYYGWHFSKKMCQWASSKMYKKRDGKKEFIIPYTRESFDELLKTYNQKIRGASGYDDIYIANMCKADFLGSSVKEEDALIQYVKDVIEDPDAYEGMPFTRFYADCVGSGTAIIWEDMI